MRPECARSCAGSIRSRADCPRQTPPRRPAPTTCNQHAKGVGELKELAQDNLFAPEGEVSPDLSDTKLILAWQETDQTISVTAYRPLSVVPYGYTGSAQKYDFSLALLDEPVMGISDFTPIEDNDDNLLPNLVFDDVSENETNEIQTKQ